MTSIQPHHNSQSNGYGNGNGGGMLVKPYERLLKSGMVEIEALAFIRGRSIARRFFILDEAQQLTPHEVKTVITRISEGSKIVLIGDPTQIDLPHHKKSGLIEAAQALSQVEAIAMIRFEKRDVVRHALVQKIIAAYEEHRGTAPRE